MRGGGPADCSEGAGGFGEAVVQGGHAVAGEEADADCGAGTAPPRSVLLATLRVAGPVAGSIGWPASVREMMRSAAAARARARRTPSASMGSSVARRPAVSTRVTGTPARVMRVSSASRVVPGMGETMATSRSASALMREDLPTLGGPVMANTRPSRRRSPRRLSFRWVESSVCRAAEFGEGGGFGFGWKVFVREVDEGFLLGHEGEQPVGPGVVERAEFAFELAEGLLALGCGFGCDEVVDGFRFEQVEAVVEEGAAGEFTGLGGAGAEGDEGVGYIGQHGGAGVEVEFGGVFAGVGGGGGEPERDGSVKHGVSVGWRRVRRAALRGCGRRLAVRAVRMARAAGPLRRMMAIAARPVAVAGAKMVGGMGVVDIRWTGRTLPTVKGFRRGRHTGPYPRNRSVTPMPMKIVTRGGHCGRLLLMVADGTT